jgi:hypothetical protein
MSRPVLWISRHEAAPDKPLQGAPCNGCGVCCLAEPCPLGMLLSGRRRGACRLVRWQADEGRYRCSALGDPARGLLARWRQRLARRWIAAGSGCDSAAEIGGA